MPRRYLIETFGCQMNFHDSERIAGLLEQAGYEPAGDEADADLIVINTCSVREHAEDKLYSRLGELRALKQPAEVERVVAVAGCVAQQEGATLLRRSPVVDVVVGTQAIKRLPALAEQAVASGERQVDINPYEDVSFPLGIARRGDPVKAYLTIIEGCNDYCAFCVVPMTRGRERMRRKADILAEAREAARSGRREVHLLGQIVNHYQAPDDPACDFAGLLEALQEIDDLERIRFASPHPRHVGERLIAAVRNPQRKRHIVVCIHIELAFAGHGRLLDEDREPLQCLRPDDDVDQGRAFEQRRAFLLRDAAGDRDDRVAAGRLQAPQFSETRVELVFSVFADTAGVHDDEVRIGGVFGDLIASLLQQPGHPLRVVEVHLAAKRLDQELLRHSDPTCWRARD